MIRRKLKPLKPIKPWKGPKPPLKMRVTPHCRVHHRDLEAYLGVVYRMFDYRTHEQVGDRADMTPEYVVNGVLSDVGNMWQRVDSIRRGRRTHDLGLILNVLCHDGFIPMGMYVIDMTKGPDPIVAYREALNEDLDPLDARCVTLKEENRRDKVFMRRVKALDQRAMEIKREQEES